MLSAADRYVDILIEHGVYEVSRDELIEGIDTFDNVHKLAAYSMQQAIDGAKLAIEAQQMGLQNAFNSAASNISGSGIRVFTSSVATLATMAAVEGAILMSQAMKADEEYRKAAEKLSRAAKSDIDLVCNRVANETYYPDLVALLADYASKLSSAFLREMALHDVFDFASVEHYNKVKAENMLKNLGKVSDKKDLLTQSFLVCPFSDVLYERVFDSDLMDPGTFKTAAYFGFADRFADRVENLCKRSINSPKNFEKYLTLYMSSTNLSRKAALRSLYKNEIHQAKEAYREANAALSDDKALCNWLSSTYSDSAEAVCNITADLAQKAAKSSLRKRIKISVLRVVDELGDTPKMGIPGYKEGMTAEQADKALLHALAEAYIKYGRRLRPHREKCLNLAEEQKKRLAERTSEWRSWKAEADLEIENLRAYRKATGLLKFSKRKNLDKRIERIELASKQYLSDCRLDEMKDSIDRTLKEADSIDFRYLSKGDGALSDDVATSLDEVFTAVPVRPTIEHFVE